MALSFNNQRQRSQVQWKLLVYLRPGAYPLAQTSLVDPMPTRLCHLLHAIILLVFKKDYGGDLGVGNLYNA